MEFNKITRSDYEGKGVVGLADTPGLSTADMQRKFDELALDVLIPAHNDLVDALNDAGIGDAVESDVITNITLDDRGRFKVSTDGGQSYEDAGLSSHKIMSDAGRRFPQRSNLIFSSDVVITDDESRDATVVTVNAGTSGEGGIEYINGKTGRAVTITPEDLYMEGISPVEYSNVVDGDTVLEAIEKVDAGCSSAKADIGNLAELTTDVKTSIVGAINDMKSSFQDGVDSVYDAVVAKGSTPATHSLADIISAIGEIETGGGYYHVRSFDYISGVPGTYGQAFTPVTIDIDVSTFVDFSNFTADDFVVSVVGLKTYYLSYGGSGGNGTYFGLNDIDKTYDSVSGTLTVKVYYQNNHSERSSSGVYIKGDVYLLNSKEKQGMKKELISTSATADHNQTVDLYTFERDGIAKIRATVTNIAGSGLVYQSFAKLNGSNISNIGGSGNVGSLTHEIAYMDVNAGDIFSISTVLANSSGTASYSVDITYAY